MSTVYYVLTVLQWLAKGVYELIYLIPENHPRG